MVSVFAPVNIAWIKYMGKGSEGPLNPSLSMTLETTGTRTSINRDSLQGPLRFSFEGSPYVPPPRGVEKCTRFLSESTKFIKILREEGFEVEEPCGLYRIRTSNNVPAGTGIATSASGFAALTLAWFGVLSGNRYSDWVSRYRADSGLRSRIARVAASGSGSACRSFHGEFVEWEVNGAVHPVDRVQGSYVDFILLLENEVKAVSSSEAHARVLGSPLFSGRRERVIGRMEKVKLSLRGRDLGALSGLVLEEALDMHELFHTSPEPFSYWNSKTRMWLDRLSPSRYPGLPGIPLVTLDAGANIHVFVESGQADAWEAFFKKEPGLCFVRDGAGKGADYREC